MRKRGFALLLLVVCCAMLGGCTDNLTQTLAPAAENAGANVPNLDLIALEPYEDVEAAATQSNVQEKDYVRVDLWLDATQNVGGVNPSEKSLYPHFSKKYREGGFHYHYGTQTGWYEDVLRDLLGAANGQRVRLLRYGNEYLDEAFLTSQGLTKANDDAAQVASIRRDLLTYALDPDGSVFSNMTAEDMKDSFYQLGTPMLNQMSRFAEDGGAELENPGFVSLMSDTLEVQIAGIKNGDESFVIRTSRTQSECALLYALKNMDTTRLNVITVDPASIRRLNGTDTDGKPVTYYEQLLREQGIFDRGLCVGVYAMQLDYMGQIASIGAAELSEPLIWGKPIYNTSRKIISYIAPMPRQLLVLVIGTRTQVQGYMTALNKRLDTDTALQGFRGPEKGELTYKTDSTVVTQQPFMFAYESTVIARPGMGYYTQHSSGATLSASDDSTVLGGDVSTVVLAPDANGVQANRTLTIRFPLTEEAAANQTNLDSLQGVAVEGVEALLLQESLPNNAKSAAAVDDGQAIAYRDKLYVYQNVAEPDVSAFTVERVTREQDDLVVTLRIRGDALKQGYYRLRVCADLTGQTIAWEPVDWIDGANSLSAAITSDDVYEWVTFTESVTKHDRDRAIPRLLQHAWGGNEEATYRGMQVPSCPPVYKAPGLAELAEQMRAAAASETEPLIRYVFDVLVDNDATVLQ